MGVRATPTMQTSRALRPWLSSLVAAAALDDAMIDRWVDPNKVAGGEDASLLPPATSAPQRAARARPRRGSRVRRFYARAAAGDGAERGWRVSACARYHLLFRIPAAAAAAGEERRVRSGLGETGTARFSRGSTTPTPTPTPRHGALADETRRNGTERIIGAAVTMSIRLFITILFVLERRYRGNIIFIF